MVVTLLMLLVVVLIISIIVCQCLRTYCGNKWRDQLPAPRNLPSPRIEHDGTPPPDLEKFIVGVIDSFNQQRTEGDQFAVLLLIPQGRNLNEVQIEREFRTATSSRQPLTNSTYPCWPDDPKLFYNYLVARPRPIYNKRSQKHAEQVILEKFHHVSLDTWQQEGSMPEYIVLYSWLMPCKECVRMIEKFAGRYAKINLIIAYTYEWPKEDKEVLSASKHSLRSRIYTLKRVPYGKRLPPPKPLPSESVCDSQKQFVSDLNDTNEWPSL